MFNEVVVGVDGRPAGRDAIALARLLVSPDGGLLLAHVEPGSGAAAAEAEERSRALLEREREACAVEAELAVLAAPSVGRGLHELAESRAVDLLVVGSCSRGFVGRVLVGNDTRAALAGSPCAVAVAPLGYLHDMGRLSTIGVGFDGSPESRQALGLATELAARHGASLRLLSVVQIPGTPWATGAAVAWGSALEDLLGDAQRAIDELASRAPAGSPPLRGESVVGVPGEELAEFGERVDLLVVGSRGYGPVRRLMVGSTSEHLASHARCPLLVLPRGVGAAGEGGGESHHP